MATVLTQEYLKGILHYDPLTGLFVWIRRNNERGPDKTGQIAGSVSHGGYIKIGLLGTKYYAHQLAWLYMTGELVDRIDHIDRNSSNNIWINLRSATHEQNLANAPRSSCGVELHGSKYRARIVVNGIRIELGSSKIRAEAETMYKNAMVEVYGDFAIYSGQ